MNGVNLERREAKCQCNEGSNRLMLLSCNGSELLLDLSRTFD